MAKNLMANDTYDARAANLLNSTVQIESPRRRMSAIISSNRPLQAYIDSSSPSIKDDLHSKVAQIMNQDMLAFGRDHNVLQ
jgi:hypothetical protein